MLSISLQNIYKSYTKNNMVIKDLSLEIFEDEFLVLVGPSGCGKTTILRMIAGLEEITEGNLYINEVYQNDLEPSSRNLSFVFQNYALLPNLTVYENILFGLLDLKLTKIEKKYLVEKVSKTLGIYEKLNRYPKNLSGGERQRVALARALVDQKKLVLFDEPLSNLDAVLRAGMRKELIKFRKDFNVTSIYVTHDQIEAMTMASRIVLLVDGEIIQVGTPHQIYNEPSHLFAAKFIGSPEINIIEFEYDKNKLINKSISIELSNNDSNLLNSFQNKIIYCGIRPDDIIVNLNHEKGLTEASLEAVENLGDKKILHLKVDNIDLRALVSNELKKQQKYYVRLNKLLFFQEDGKRIKDYKFDKVFFENFSPNNNIKREIINYGYQVVNNFDSKTIIIKKNKDNRYQINLGDNVQLIDNILKIFQIINYKH